MVEVPGLLVVLGLVEVPGLLVVPVPAEGLVLLVVLGPAEVPGPLHEPSSEPLRYLSEKPDHGRSGANERGLKKPVMYLHRVPSVLSDGADQSVSEPGLPFQLPVYLKAPG
jgi:hypothetical protein